MKESTYEKVMEIMSRIVIIIILIIGWGSGALIVYGCTPRISKTNFRAYEELGDRIIQSDVTLPAFTIIKCTKDGVIIPYHRKYNKELYDIVKEQKIALYKDEFLCIEITKNEIKFYEENLDDDKIYGKITYTLDDEGWKKSIDTEFIPILKNTIIHSIFNPLVLIIDSLVVFEIFVIREKLDEKKYKKSECLNSEN